MDVMRRRTLVLVFGGTGFVDVDLPFWGRGFSACWCVSRMRVLACVINSSCLSCSRCLAVGRLWGTWFVHRYTTYVRAIRPYARAQAGRALLLTLVFLRSFRLKSSSRVSGRRSPFHKACRDGCGGETEHTGIPPSESGAMRKHYLSF